MLKTKNLSFSYGNSTSFNFPDITLNADDSLLILGKSGSGKSTLLNLLGGIIQQPNTGEIWIDNTDITTLSSSKLDVFRGKQIGIVFQQPYFIQAISALENLKLFTTLNKEPFIEKEVFKTLEALQIADRIHDKPQNLSIGEQQRLSIARAIINRPSLLLADEPTSALDDHNCEVVIQLLLEQSRIHQTNLVVVTHDHRLKPFFDNHLTINR